VTPLGYQNCELFDSIEDMEKDIFAKCCCVGRNVGNMIAMCFIGRNVGNISIVNSELNLNFGL